MHLLLHVSAFRDLTLSTEKVGRIAEIFRQIVDDESFSTAFFPTLTYISAYFPLLKYMTGGLIKDGYILKGKIALFKELLGYLLPIVAERLSERAKGDGGSQPGSDQIDQMQVLIDQGDGDYALVYVRTLLMRSVES